MINKIVPELGRLNVPEVGVGPIHEVAHAVEKFYVISSATELDVFDNLINPKSAIELAEEKGFHKEITEKLCDALVATNFLIKTNGKYALTDLSKTFLVTSSPLYQGHLIKLMKTTHEKRWSKLGEALKDGPVMPDTLHGDNAVFDKCFIVAMAEGALCGSLQRTVEVLRDNSDFMNARRSLDLGGGHGLYSIAFTKLNPGLEAFVFDLPLVIESVTKEVVSSNGDNIKLLKGDLTKDDIGSGYDVVFVSDVLYMSEESLGFILNTINASLNDGGLFISKHYHLDDLSKDSTAVFFDLMFSIFENGHGLYSIEKFCDLIESNGFSVVQIEDISSSSSPSRIVIAKKVRT